MQVNVYGHGCVNCKKLLELTNTALEKLGQSIQANYVTDLAAIASAGILRTPAVTVNGKIAVAGRVPGIHELTYLLEEAIKTA